MDTFQLQEQINTPQAVMQGTLINFVPFPMQPNVRLSQEQLDALFPPKNRPAVVRELVRLVQLTVQVQAEINHE